MIGDSLRSLCLAIRVDVSVLRSSIFPAPLFSYSAEITSLQCDQALMVLDNESLFWSLLIQHEWNRSASVTNISIEVIVVSPQTTVALLVIDAIRLLGQRICANRSEGTVERSHSDPSIS